MRQRARPRRLQASGSFCGIGPRLCVGGLSRRTDESRSPVMRLWAVASGSELCFGSPDLTGLCTEGRAHGTP